MQITRLVEVDKTLFTPRVLIAVPTSGVNALSRLLRLSLHLSRKTLSFSLFQSPFKRVFTTIGFLLPLLPRHADNDPFPEQMSETAT